MKSPCNFGEDFRFIFDGVAYNGKLDIWNMDGVVANYIQKQWKVDCNVIYGLWCMFLCSQNYLRSTQKYTA